LRLEAELMAAALGDGFEHCACLTRHFGSNTITWKKNDLGFHRRHKFHVSDRTTTLTPTTPADFGIFSSRQGPCAAAGESLTGFGSVEAANGTNYRPARWARDSGADGDLRRRGAAR